MPDYAPYQVEGQDRHSQIVVICDHAANTVPDFISGGDLGISQADMNRHIAYDIGAFGASRRLAERLSASFIHSNFSRLVIDPNRAEDDPTLVMQLYDGSIIPANRGISDNDKNLRKEKCYGPYHNALKDLLAKHTNPIIISVHTFTKQLNGYAERPWHIGILYADDKRLATPLIDLLNKQPDLCVGDNQPYSGNLKGDTMDRHALQQGRIHVLIEIRNDLIEIEADQHKWADILAPIILQAIDIADTEETENGHTNTN